MTARTAKAPGEVYSDPGILEITSLPCALNRSTETLAVVLAKHEVFGEKHTQKLSLDHPRLHYLKAHLPPEPLKHRGKRGKSTAGA